MNKLLHFTAQWCVPCQKSQPIIDKFINDNKIEYQKIDIDIFPEKAKEYNIMGIPTLISYKDGMQYDRHTGISSEFIVKGMFSL
jgi:thioredoxin 1